MAAPAFRTVDRSVFAQEKHEVFDRANELMRNIEREYRTRDDEGNLQFPDPAYLDQYIMIAVQELLPFLSKYNIVHKMETRVGAPSLIKLSILRSIVDLLLDAVGRDTALDATAAFWAFRNQLSNFIFNLRTVADIYLETYALQATNIDGSPVEIFCNERARSGIDVGYSALNQPLRADFAKAFGVKVLTLSELHFYSREKVIRAKNEKLSPFHWAGDEQSLRIVPAGTSPTDRYLKSLARFFENRKEWTIITAISVVLLIEVYGCLFGVPWLALICPWSRWGFYLLLGLGIVVILRSWSSWYVDW